jgi:hypothetical protein
MLKQELWSRQMLSPVQHETSRLNKGKPEPNRSESSIKLISEHGICWQHVVQQVCWKNVTTPTSCTNCPTAGASRENTTLDPVKYEPASHVQQR